jgi:hypothetical protein
MALLKCFCGVGLDKNRLAAIAALDDVMRQDGDDDAGDAGHGRSLAEMRQSVNAGVSPYPYPATPESAGNRGKNSGFFKTRPLRPRLCWKNACKFSSFSESRGRRRNSGFIRGNSGFVERGRDPGLQSAGRAVELACSLQTAPKIVAVDIPIGLLDSFETGGRCCDREARKCLGPKRRASVFPAGARAWRPRPPRDGRGPIWGAAQNDALSRHCLIALAVRSK